jgi:hypothetical protein
MYIIPDGGKYPSDFVAGKMSLTGSCEVHNLRTIPSVREHTTRGTYGVSFNATLHESQFCAAWISCFGEGCSVSIYKALKSVIAESLSGGSCRGQFYRTPHTPRTRGAEADSPVNEQPRHRLSLASVSAQSRTTVWT